LQQRYQSLAFGRVCGRTDGESGMSAAQQQLRMVAYAIATIIAGLSLFLGAF